MIEPTWQSDCGTVKLWLGDCLEILPTLEPGSVDAVVTDPPYGINADAGQAKRANHQHGAALCPSKDYGKSDWDSCPADHRAIEACRDYQAIIFGGNYFVLPPARCWLVWDKMNGANDYADCELAWTNLDKPVRRIAFRWHGMLRDGNDGERVHPTQKPTEVMAWCIEQLPEPCPAILDPFMGSGTTGVAAVRLGRRFLGIEIEPKYFEIAKRRIEEELARFAFLEPNKAKEPDPELFAVGATGK